MKRIENDFLSIEVSPEGAELMSLIEKNSGREWLWQGDSKWWGKRAPNLFPFIGCVKNGEYSHEGAIYSMTKHGFARDLSFELVETKADCLKYRLTSNEGTRVLYPFDFELEITFKLQGNTLTVAHEVLNTGQDRLYFSLGGHPAFNCNMLEEVWKLRFEVEESLESYGIDLSNGLILNEKKRLFEDSREIVLSSELFKEDALVFEHLKSGKVDLEGPDNQRLSFDFKDFPLLAFWSPMGPFLCIEPWFGMADHTGHSSELKEKYGVVSLEPTKTFSAAYSITLGSQR